VLVVGQSPPLVGGIASYVGELVSDPTVSGAVDLRTLDTPPAAGTTLGTPTRANITRSLRHVRAVHRAARAVDVVHLNFAAAPLFPMLRATACATAARLAGARVILHVHTGRVAEQCRDPRYRMLMRMAGRACARVVVLSPDDEAALAALGINPVRLRNGVNLARFATPRAAPSVPTLLYAGTLAASKGLLDLRDALRLLADRPGGPPRLQVVVVGDSRQDAPGADARMRRELAGCGVPVEFVGAMPRDDVRRMLTAATALCLPSHSEGAPLSVLEAMAAGVAVVATDVGAVGEMLDGGRAGYLVPARNPRALAAALARACTDETDRARRETCARSRVADRYDLRETLRDVVALYEEVAATPDARRARSRPIPRPTAYGTP
jgi:glycosyltransferase involved in cell wall biosynthesis